MRRSACHNGDGEQVQKEPVSNGRRAERVPPFLNPTHASKRAIASVMILSTSSLQKATLTS